MKGERQGEGKGGREGEVRCEAQLIAAFDVRQNKPSTAYARKAYIIREEYIHTNNI